ncbi:MAG: TRAM domain-containing protein [Deltaproteobacteria bacterium]
MQLVTEDRLATGGEAVARADDGRVVFVAGAAPNETVEVEITQQKKRFLRARVLSVVEPSAARVEPQCAHYEICGGCVLQHVEAATQTRLKDAATIQTITRVGRVDPSTYEHLAPWSGAAYGYRTRARFAVADGVVGYRGAKSHRVVDVESCPILAPGAARGLAALRTASPSVDGIVDVSVIGSGDDVLADAPSALEGVRTDADATLEADDGLGLMLLSPRVFAQANAAGNAALVEQVTTWVEAAAPSTVLELYAGSGNFTRSIARHAARVVAIEQSEEASQLAKRAAVEHVEVWGVSVESGLLSWSGGAPDLVLLDPPRRGVEASTMEALVKLAPSKLVYVSCDPGTFARDAAALGEAGYRLDAVRVFDLYPQTAHVELVAQLSR